MLPPELGVQLQAATKLPAGAFGTLYIAGQGTIGYWRIAGRDHQFAPVSFHLTNADGFARKIGLAKSPDPRVWRPLIKEVIASATVV